MARLLAFGVSLRGMILLVVLFVSAPFAAAQSPEEAEILAFMDRWRTAYGNAASPDEMLAYYAPDAVFWGTGGREPFVGHEVIRGYFATQFGNFPTRLPVELHDPIIRVYDAAFATNTGTYTFRVTTANGQQIQQTHRYSFAYVKQDDGQWIIVHQHSSAIPQ